MIPQIYYDYLGYFASILVATALMQTSILRLRMINLVGASLFMVYALLIRAWPVAILNSLIVCINIYNLWKLLHVEEEFRVLSVQPNSEYLQQFLEFHKDDIQKFVPEFKALNPNEAQIVFFVLRNMLPVGLFIAKESEGGKAVIQLDYVIAGYRDFKVGKFVYRQKADFFRERGIRQLISYPGTKAHQDYLERMGFSRDFVTSDRHLYQLNLE
jgi:hypothetical protein